MTAETLDDDISAVPQGAESSASDARREQLLSFIQTHEFVRIFDLARHREPGSYRLIVERKGPIPPP